MRYINRQVPVAEVARVLGLRMDGASKIHCWHPERHKNGDRTASVGIRARNNTVKCFGCDSKPMGPIDFVMDVLDCSAADGALWIAARFSVPTIAAGRRLDEVERYRGRIGHERGLDLLVRSGIFGTLSEATRMITPVFLAMAEKLEPTDQESSIRISYGGISRYSGVSSPTAIRKALTELGEIGFLRFPEGGFCRSPERQAALYIVSPNSTELHELAQAIAAQMNSEIAAGRELRARLRKEKTRAWREKQPGKMKLALLVREKSATPPRGCTKYKPVYPTNSVNQ
jgi:hypothetical protein